MTGSGNRKENLNQRENRQAISRTHIFNSLYEHKRKIQQESYIQHNDTIEQKIDKLTVMMGKLVTEDKGQNRQFNP